MSPDRRTGVAAALLAVIALGVLASALEATAVSSAYEVPEAGTGGEGTSILEALLALVNAVLELFGIDLEPVAPRRAPGSLLGVLFSVAAAMYPGVLVVGVGLLAVAAGLFAGRRLERSAAATSLRRAIAGLRRTRCRSRTDSDESDSPSWPPATPDDGVSKAWAELTAGIDASRPYTRTPGEWAEAAVDAGYDAEYVEAVTRRFRAVRYGGERVDSRERDRTSTPNGTGYSNGTDESADDLERD